ncbi:hypothetical protein FI667_g5671, partial [Globisporangium splendens]
MQSSTAAAIAFTNRCDHQINLWDNVQEFPLAPGASTQLLDKVDEGFRGMFRAGRDPQATLAEFTCSGGKLWYDISVIPTSPTQGPAECSSLAACKQFTGGTGYNEPMQIAPQGNLDGTHCRVLTCLQDGCDDAYQFPKDDTKTHNCPLETVFVVTFCPGGSGGAATTTSAPPSEAPTQAPMQMSTETPTPTPSAANASNATAQPEEDQVAKEADPGVLSSASSTSSSLESDHNVAAPTSDTTISSSIPAPPTATASSTAPTEPPVVETSTQTGNSSSTSGTAGILVIGAFVLVAAVAVAAIVVVRRKKRKFDALSDKSPVVGNSGLPTL